MDRKRNLIVGGVLALVIVGGSASVAIATIADSDEPLTGSTLDEATTAALAHAGGGSVVDTEVGDGGSAYGVEVRLDDGSVVEVELDANFHVIGQESDDHGGDDSELEAEGYVAKRTVDVVSAIARPTVTSRPT